MSFSTAIASLRTAIEATGLTQAAGDNDRTLTQSSRKDFDGCYLLRVDSGASLYQELKLDPEAFTVILTMEIGTTQQTDEDFADMQARAVLRSQKAIQALISANHTDVINITRNGTSIVQQTGRKHIISQQFTLIYRE